MAFYVLEPSLRDEGGHHFEFSATIAANSGSRPEDVVVFAHKDCKPRFARGARIVPWFIDHIHQDIKTRLFYNLSNFLHFNKSLFQDLRRLAKQFRLGPDDVVVFPTISENQLWGIVRWAESFPETKRPIVICYLMFSPAEPLGEKAFFYKKALAKAFSAGSSVRVFAGGRQLAREYSALAGVQVSSHPVPIAIGASKRQGESENFQVLLHAGTAKSDKGFLLLPDLVERLSAEHPTDKFLVHADFRSEPKTPVAMSRAYAKLLSLAEANDNFMLEVGTLDKQRYLSLLEQADCYICTYNPLVYGQQTSGVAWEAISLGLPILGPAKTFIQREAQEWGAGFHPYPVWSADSISDAYTVFRRDLATLTAESKSAKEKYIAANNDAAIAAHFKECAQEQRRGAARKIAGPLLLDWLRFRILQKVRR